MINQLKEILFVLISVFTLTICKGQTLQNAPPPNILIITVDNVGFGDFSFYNEDSPILTPHLEKLAGQGVRLTNYYTASPTCTVSRASLLTGRIPQRHKTTRQLGGIEGNYGIGLRQSEIIIPKMLNDSKAHYVTGAFGKWNIGFAPGSRPTERGFDEYLGIASGNADHFTHVYAGKKDLYHNTESINREGEYSTDLFAKAAIDFIDEHSNNAEPWFVYLPFDAPHHPGDRNIDPDAENIWIAPDYAFEPYGLSPDEADPKKRFNAVVTSIDMAIGRVMKKLDDIGVADNTFVFFYSDNGAFYPYIDSGIQSNAPLKGAGVTLWEGGIRVPALVRWPGKVPEGEVLDTRLWSLDLFPTCGKLAGATMPRDRFIDGKNMLPNLTGQNSHSPHETLYFEYIDFDALIWGNWKVIRESEKDDWQLFNLKNDLSETTNMADERNDLVQKLSASFELQKDEIENYLKIEDQFQNKN